MKTTVLAKVFIVACSFLKLKESVNKPSFYRSALCKTNKMYLLLDINNFWYFLSMLVPKRKTKLYPG